MRTNYLAKLRLAGLALAIGLALFAFSSLATAQTALDAPVAQSNAQATPAPTRAPSGSNPTIVAPTDVPIEWSLFWALMFFVVLGLGLLFANWLVRRGTFNEPENRV